ncbi:hypothetical protein ABTX81_03355 [Kitasatospora sp. NPDC097605]|uniref:hypothetical protein n=1 Tax=Kitasatospora sp. NPDC097605 TaxID=3157226 RepID=UPI0033240CA6
MKLKASGVLLAVGMAAGGVLIAAPGASASTACNATTITINKGSGAEDPSQAQGHSHSTGRHYVGAIDSNKIWYWYADNDGGSDGDTWDTFYGIKQC